MLTVLVVTNEIESTYEYKTKSLPFYEETHRYLIVYLGANENLYKLKSYESAKFLGYHKCLAHNMTHIDLFSYDCDRFISTFHHYGWAHHEVAVLSMILEVGFLV